MKKMIGIIGLMMILSSCCVMVDHPHMTPIPLYMPMHHMHPMFHHHMMPHHR